MKGVGISRIFLFLFIPLFMFSSCTHTSPFKDERYVESFGDSGEIVVSLSVQEASSIVDISELKRVLKETSLHTLFMEA